MDTLARTVSAIDCINRWVGRAVSWLTLATVMICGAVVLLRYWAGQGHVWMQELYVWTHAMTFLLAAGFAYLLNAHVRVDIFYAKARTARQSLGRPVRRDLPAVPMACPARLDVVDLRLLLLADQRDLGPEQRHAGACTC